MTDETPRFIKQGEELIPNPVYLVPQRVVLYFFQNWGQSMQERLDILNEAIKLAGFKDIKAEVSSQGLTVAYDNPLFVKFYADLRACWPKGQFEEEEEEVRKVILRYQGLNSDEG